MTREIVLGLLCPRTAHTALNMDRRTNGKREISEDWLVLPWTGFKVADDDAPTAQRNERREERVVDAVRQVDDAAGRVPATRHTVEISDCVLATMQRRAEWRRLLPRPLPLLMSSEKAKPIRRATKASAATTTTTTTVTRDDVRWLVTGTYRLRQRNVWRSGGS